MKRKIMVVLAVCALTLCGCGNGENPSINQAETKSQAAKESESEGSAKGPENSGAAETAEKIAQGEKGSYKIGISMSDLTNTVWAELVEYAQQYGPETYGAEVTVVQFDGDPAKLVSQIENFTESGYDGIIVCPDDSDSIEDACKTARDAGVKVCVYTASMKNQDFDYNVAEYDTGYAAGQAAADWIESRENLMKKEEIQVGILNYRQIPTVIDRENGFEAAMKERLNNVNVVIRAEAISALEGLEGAETFFQAYPDLDLIYSISGSGATGANEAAIAAGKNTDDFGIVCVDAVQEVCQSIKNGESIRASISLGGGKMHAKDMIDGLVTLFKGGEVEEHYFMPITKITLENLDEYCQEQGYVLQ